MNRRLRSALLAATDGDLATVGGPEDAEPTIEDIRRWLATEAFIVATAVHDAVVAGDGPGLTDAHRWARQLVRVRAALEPS